MQLSDILSSAQLDAIREVATRQTDAEQYAPALSSKMREFLYAFAAECACRFTENFWMALQSEYTYEPDVIVCISDKRAQAIHVHRNVVFAKHLGEMLKRGDSLCWIVGERIVPITWHNWKSIYVKLTTIPEDDGLPVQIGKREMRRMKIDSDREKMFYEMALSDRYKKLGKRGYNMSFDEIRALRRQEAYERAMRTVVGEAAKIMAVL